MPFPGLHCSARRPSFLGGWHRYVRGNFRGWAGGPHRGGRCLAEFNSAGRSSATRRGREAPGDLRHRVGAQQWAMWSVSLVGWRAFKARAVPHTERGNGGQCDPPGQGRSSVPRRTGDKSVTRRCEPVESGPPAVSGPSEESVVTESGERSREKERHSPFDKLGRVLRRDGSASSIGFRSRSSSQASTASKAHSQQVSPARLTSGGEKSLVDPVEGTPLTAWRPLSRPILREEDVGNTSSSSVDVSTCSEGGSIRYPTSGVTRPETPRAAKRSRQEGSNSGSPTSGPPLARRGRIRTPFTGLRSEPVVVVEKMDLAEFLMRSGDSASGSADPPEAPMGGESRATKTSSRKAHKSGSSHSSRGTDSTPVNVAKDRPYKELGTASESDECEEATTVHHRGDQYVSIRAGLAAGAPSDALKDVLDWEREIVSECDSIINTARKSANLKGTSVKSLKGSATKIKGALANVCDALYPEEIRTLKANNRRLQEDVNRMRKEIEELKVELRVARLRPPTSPSQSPSEVARRVKEDERERNFHASVMASVRNLLDASLDGIRRRLPPEECLRPPLASDRVAQKGPSSANVTPAAGVDLSAAPLPRRERVGRRKQISKSGGPETGEVASSSLSTAPPAPKGKNGEAKSAKSPDAAEATASTSTPQTAEAWNVVVSRKAKAKKTKAAAQAAEAAADASKKAKAKPKKRRPQKKRSLKAPRNPAVMLSISPDAAASLSSSLCSPDSPPQALPNEPKLGPPSPNSSRDNQSPNLYSIWLKPDISGTISPRLPVFGFPVEGATSPTSQAGLRYWRLKFGQYGRQLSEPTFDVEYLRDQEPQSAGVWTFLHRPDLPYKMAPVLDPENFSTPILILGPLSDRGDAVVFLSQSPVEFGWVFWELWAFKVSQDGGRAVKSVFKTAITPRVPVVERRGFLRGSGRDLGYPPRGLV
ncbi:hypothetical protein ACJJTC_010803 [Scirpophaga incertulas]